MMNDMLEIMKGITLLNNLTPNQLQNLSNSVIIDQYNKGQFIYKEGFVSKYVYILLKGSVKTGSHADKTNVIVKEILSDNDMFGENVFVESKLRNEFVESITPVQIMKIPLHEFKILVMQNPLFYQDIMAVIMDKLYLLEERMKNFVFLKAKKRISKFLVDMCTKKGIKIGMYEILLKLQMSQKEIALLTDTSRQTVARVLGELKVDKIIHFTARKPGRILVRDMEMLNI